MYEAGQLTGRVDVGKCVQCDGDVEFVLDIEDNVDERGGVKTESAHQIGISIHLYAGLGELSQVNEQAL